MAYSIWNLWGLLGGSEDSTIDEAARKEKLFQFIESRYDVHNPILKTETKVNDLDFFAGTALSFAKNIYESKDSQHLKSELVNSLVLYNAPKMNAPLSAGILKILEYGVDGVLLVAKNINESEDSQYLKSELLNSFGYNSNENKNHLILETENKVELFEFDSGAKLALFTVVQNKTSFPYFYHFESGDISENFSLSYSDDNNEITAEEIEDSIISLALDSSYQYINAQLEL